MPGRVLVSDHTQHRRCGPFRVAGLVSVVATPCLTYRLVHLIVVGDRAFAVRHGATGPVGAKWSRLDGGDVNAKRSHFFAKGFQDAFESILATMIEGESGRGCQAANGGDGKDMTSAAHAHSRQHRFDDRDGSEDVALELPPKLADARFLEQSLMPIASISDEDIDWSVVVLDLADHRRDGFLIGHFDAFCDGICPVKCLVRRRIFWPPHRPDNTVACVQCCSCASSSEARTDPSDKNGLLCCRHSSPHLRISFFNYSRRILRCPIEIVL